MKNQDGMLSTGENFFLIYTSELYGNPTSSHLVWTPEKHGKEMLNFAFEYLCSYFEVIFYMS
jgi:hypothetical protein